MKAAKKLVQKTVLQHLTARLQGCLQRSESGKCGELAGGLPGADDDFKREVKTTIKV